MHFDLQVLWCFAKNAATVFYNHLTAGAAYIRVFLLAHYTS